MEAYKGNTLESIQRSMEILSLHPKQVIVLKGTQKVCGLNGRSAGLQRRMIDKGQTRGFGQYCRLLLAAKGGDSSVQRQLLELGREADAHMAKTLADVADLPTAMEKITKKYTAAEKRILRTDAPYPEGMIDKIMDGILELSLTMFVDHPSVKELPDLSEVPNKFIFCSALCVYLLSLRWVSVGSPMKIRPDRIRNDIIDMNFAAFATYFDGLLTADKKLISIHREANLVLHTMFLTK